MNNLTDKSKKAHRAQLGMTLVEIMIVMAIIALVMAGVGFALIPQFNRAKVKQTTADIQTVRSAAILWLSDNTGCPTIQDLVDNRFLDKDVRTVDAWGNAFQIECNGEDVEVSSGGPDGEMGSEDDLK
ncbi:MAG: prepilin-type N-terminal cleavage/methylation domain-containing protein [Myxococcales bacterium]|nr:prepilin-type N-terminal cleavage/methylation domain-containing protein [Myxococcales bacterium]MCB9709270.1 prepilin-type N-terminal cleavage/methylation domain-containing protein [Myxococcales bacterium]